MDSASLERTVTQALAGLQRTPTQSMAVEVVSGSDQGLRVSAGQRLCVGTAEGNELQLKDPSVSRFHLELELKGGRICVNDPGSTNGIFLGNARVLKAEVPVGTVLTVGNTQIKVLETGTSDLEVAPHSELAGLIGRSPAMRALMAAVVRAAQSEAAVLVQGESGVGKERVAHALHLLSPRRERPFEVVDCGTLSAELVASELFGHERGAFTGADQARAGCFERAGDGTVFLDEIGELPAQVQPMLLGVLERRQFKRVGGNQVIHSKARIVAATNRELREAVNARTFRQDLYFRLAVVRLSIPPLRERPEDVGSLIEHFLETWGVSDSGRALFAPAVVQWLARKRWEGNVRELRNFVEATVALGALPSEGPAHGGLSQPVDTHRPYHQAKEQMNAEFEVRYLTRLLERTGGNVTLAAKEAGLDRSHLHQMLKRHGIGRQPKQ